MGSQDTTKENILFQTNFLRTEEELRIKSEEL